MSTSPSSDDLVLGRPACAVPRCDRSGWEHGLCSAHARRWKDQGRPDRDAFLADPGRELNGRRELTTCTVAGCRFGSSGLGLCMPGTAAAGSARLSPTRPCWAASVPTVSADGRSECQLPFCTVWVENDTRQFCKAHHTRWDQLGRPDPEQYVARCDAARASPHRLQRPDAAAETGASVRHSVPTRSADHHHPFSGRDLGRQARRERRRRVAARPRRAAVAGTDRRQGQRLVSGLRAARPRGDREAARRHRVGGRVPPRRLAAAHPATG